MCAPAGCLGCGMMIRTRPKCRFEWCGRQEPGRYGHRARVDIDFTLPMMDDALEDLQFWPDDAGVEVDLPFEDDLPHVEGEGDES